MYNDFNWTTVLYHATIFGLVIKCWDVLWRGPVFMGAVGNKSCTLGLLSEMLAIWQSVQSTQWFGSQDTEYSMQGTYKPLQVLYPVDRLLSSMSGRH